MIPNWEENMDTASILKDLRTERDRIDRAISALEGLDGTGILRVTGPGAEPVTTKARGRRKMSPAGRKRISEGMKARWAQRSKKAAPAQKAASAKKAAPARHMSAATRRRLSILAKKRWAARKKAAKS
jgi:hypothetical protein